MPGPREITDVAIDSALHALPEPQNGWRNHIPPEDLGQMLSAGSGQITLQALVASLRYGPKPDAVRKLTTYSTICLLRFMLAEPWSGIYSEAIVNCWAATVKIAREVSEPALANLFVVLLELWARTCRGMEASADGKVWVIPASCRSWGFPPEGDGTTALWRIASGRVAPPSPGSARYGTPGAYDNYGWLLRSEYLCLAIFRAAAAKFPAETSIAALFPTGSELWAARVDMQLVGYADGSRIWVMGSDEPEFVDDDPNGNTPGRLIGGVLRRRVVSYPRWPNPPDGLEHLRQVNCRGDVDGSPAKGWTIWHSHLGDARGKNPATGEAGFVTFVPPYLDAPLLFHYLIRAGERRWLRLYPNENTQPGLPKPPATPPTTPPPSSAGFKLTARPLESGEWLIVADTAAPLEIVSIHPEPNHGEPQRWVARRKGA